MRPLRDISRHRSGEGRRRLRGSSELPKARETAAGGYPYI